MEVSQACPWGSIVKTNTELPMPGTKSSMRLLHRAAPHNEILLVAFVLTRTDVERGFIDFARTGNEGRGG